MPPVDLVPAGDHHALAGHEVVLLLDTHATDGLTDAEARSRLERYGPNQLPRTATAGPLRRLLGQLHHPLVYVLLAAAAITLALGDLVEASVILGVVVVNTIVGFVQESKAEAALDALRAMVSTQARVRRSGRVATVASEELVPGDVVLVEAGDKVPADLRLLRHARLAVDESALTGESLPVVKDEDAVPIETPVSDRHSMLYSGTLVTSGSGVGVAVATGAGTEIGEIHRLVGTADRLATPLTRRLSWFSKVLTVVILGLAGLTFALGLLRGEPPADMFHAAVALAVGAIPEGLPAAVTITLAIGVGRMARRRAVVRRLPAVETLGSTTVVCTDKTGTLTENRMTVTAAWTARGPYGVSGVGYAPEGRLTDADGAPAALTADGAPAPGGDVALAWSVRAAVLCNDANLVHEDGDWQVGGDPTEGALLTLAAKAGVAAEGLRAAAPRLATLPFSSERGVMATAHRRGAPLDGAGLLAAPPAAGDVVVLVKGATERVLEACTGLLGADGRTGPLDRDAVLAQVAALAADGLRVLATAVGVARRAEPVEDGTLGDLVLTGLVAMLDPPRPAAIGAVASCRTAGVQVKMITGDHAATAAAIARRVGLDTETGGVVTGAELARLDDAQLPDVAERTTVFARVTPEQKLRLVDALQARRHVVAMTGDGVNDAPALRQADIGVAMGRSGTQVATEAADMVLTDDDFATIEAAVEEGRGVFDNLTKFIVWTLPTNMGEGLVILVAIVLGLSLPILPVQILWINMTTAVLLGLMLAFEPKEPGIMLRPPRDPARPLLTGALVARILLVSALLLGGSWWVFEQELANGASIEVARTAAVNLFVAVEVAYLFSCRSLTRPVRSLGLLANRWVLGGVALQVLAQAAITYLPVMNEVFATAPLGVDAWLRIVAVTAVAAVVVAVDKRLRGGTL